jgi:hypothetical protein
MPSPTRRAFLATSGAAGAAALAAPAAHALGANDRLSVGVIGIGNRGRTIATEAIKNGCRLVALADVAEFRFGLTKAWLDKLGSTAKPELYGDYRKLLDRNDIDAVIIATPDHHHKACLSPRWPPTSTPTSRSR